MEVQAKFDVGDIVWCISCNKAVKQRIDCVRIEVETPDKYEVVHTISGGAKMPENLLFKTKEELLKSL